MQVTVQLAGFPAPPAGFEGSKEVLMDFPGNSLGDLVKYLLSCMEGEAEELFLTGPLELSPDLVTIVNGIAVSDSNRFHLPLSEGDRIELVSSPG